MFVIKSPVGVFSIDEKGELLEFKPFISDDEAIQELSSTQIDESSLEGYLLFLANQEEFIEKAGLVYGEYLEARRRLAIKLVEKRLVTTLREDEKIIQSIETLADLHKVLNRLASRLASLSQAYGMNIVIGDGDVDFRSILNQGKEVSAHSVEKLSTQIENLIQYKESLELDIEALMIKTAPNITGLVGPLLGAKIITLSGSVERLGRMPASRIQVLGAEKAMFRHLREKGKPPKHGVIFQHPTISKSPWWQRGKIARSLASKLAIASRMDAFSDKDHSEQLKSDFMQRYEQIKVTYQNEPKKMRIIRTPREKKRRRRLR